MSVCCCDIRAATWWVLFQTPLSPQLSLNTEEQVEEDRGGTPLFLSSKAGACIRESRRPLSRSNSWFGERVSRECRLLTVGAQSDSCSVTRAQTWLCRWRRARRLGGHYGTGTDRRESSAHWQESSASTATLFMEIPRAESEHKHLAWRSQEADDLDYTVLSSFALTEKSWLQITKNVYRASGCVLGLFCFRYKARLNKKPSSFLSPTHFFWKPNFWEWKMGLWECWHISLHHNGTCYVNQ